MLDIPKRTERDEKQRVNVLRAQLSFEVKMKCKPYLSDSERFERKHVCVEESRQRQRSANGLGAATSETRVETK